LKGKKIHGNSKSVEEMEYFCGRIPYMAGDWVKNLQFSLAQGTLSFKISYPKVL
jgi:hypothetical protein